MQKIFFSLLLAAMTLVCGPARAELLKGPYEYPSAVAFEAQLGAQIGLGGFTPGGFKLSLGYDHRFARAYDGLLGIWFFGDLNLTVGPGVGVCPTLQGDYFECSGIGYGSDFEVKAGIQLTFRTSLPLVPYLKGGLAIAFTFGRDYCDDNGVAVPLASVGGGARYFFTKHFAASLGADLNLGPGFYSGGRCFGGDHNELWRSLSILAGAQYAL